MCDRVARWRRPGTRAAVAGHHGVVHKVLGPLYTCPLHASTTHCSPRGPGAAYVATVSCVLELGSVPHTTFLVTPGRHSRLALLACVKVPRPPEGKETPLRGGASQGMRLVDCFQALDGT